MNQSRFEGGISVLLLGVDLRLRLTVFARCVVVVP